MRSTAALLFMIGCIGPAWSVVAADRPNIVVVLVDDLGFSDIGPYGGEVPTPNLDRLAARGVRFTQAYNAARCSPSRASLLTGLYPHQAGMGWLDNRVEPTSKGIRGRLLPRSVTIAEVLRDAGYFTAMTGKWHLGQQHGCTPWGRGFRRSLNSRFGEVYFPQGGRPPWDREPLSQWEGTPEGFARLRQGLVFDRPVRRLGPEVRRRGPSREEALLPLHRAGGGSLPSPGAG